MGSDSRLIFYSTIHLSRREEILIQSIISLYNSKDNFKWIYRETGEDISAIVVGSEARSLIKKGEDPFLAVDEKHVIVMLGDQFYPKNARALVRVALPIKALDLVDKLGYVERNIISKPIAIGYIAANIAAAMKDANATTPPDIPPPRGYIDFVVNKPDAQLSSSSASQDRNENAYEFTYVKPSSVPVPILDEDSISNAPSASVQQAVIQDELSKPSVEELATEVANRVLKASKAAQQVAVKESEAKLEGFPSFKFTFPSDTGLSESSENSETNRIQLAESDDVLAYASSKEAVTAERYSMRSLDNFAAHNTQDTIEYSVPHKRSTISSVPDDAVNIAEDIDSTLVKEIEAPTLREVVPKHILRRANVVPLHNNGIKSTPTLVSTESVSLTPPDLSAKSVPVSITPQQDTVPEVKPSVEVISKRIKLLRWPKSELIQRHPGNAILASMVINIPMSVEDMAKQSDLPIQICQKFVDAVVESNVAIYVDLPDSMNQSVVAKPTATEPVAIALENVGVNKQEDKKEKRKGILYRIRAALGLLRN